ncbi:hypothetical protein LDENG_00237090 [Lucifuga dentata]|nr:hypothetical protein LDENG_00237090 [Lucifuga dentata]
MMDYLSQERCKYQQVDFNSVGVSLEYLILKEILQNIRKDEIQFYPLRNDCR